MGCQTVTRPSAPLSHLSSNPHRLSLSLPAFPSQQGRRVCLLCAPSARPPLPNPSPGEPKREAPSRTASTHCPTARATRRPQITLQAPVPRVSSVALQVTTSPHACGTSRSVGSLPARQSVGVPPRAPDARSANEPAPRTRLHKRPNTRTLLSHTDGALLDVSEPFELSICRVVSLATRLLSGGGSGRLD